MTIPWAEIQDKIRLQGLPYSIQDVVFMRLMLTNFWPGVHFMSVARNRTISKRKEESKKYDQDQNLTLRSATAFRRDQKKTEPELTSSVS